MPLITGKIHELKTVPPFFNEVHLGVKTFEIRKDDRGFKVGDVLELREFLPATDRFTGRSCWRKVTYITDFGQTPGTVVMAIEPTQNGNAAGGGVQQINRSGL